MSERLWKVLHLASKNKPRFPKELIDAAIAHSKETKKNVVVVKKATQVDRPSIPNLKPSVGYEDSQTTPRVTDDFEKIFSKVVGTRAIPETKTTTNNDYSETYQRAFGRMAEQKGNSSKQEKKTITRTERKSIHSESRDEGFSVGYATVFGRLNREENTEGNAKIRESLKQCVGNVEKIKKPETIAPSRISVFEMLGESAEKQEGSSAPASLKPQESEEVSITPGNVPTQPSRSVFEMLTHSDETKTSTSGNEQPGNTQIYSEKSVFERLARSSSKK
jgi:hypothetical protein